VIYNLKIWII